MSNASAPGKLVVVGEYAVLHGAPAIATSVGVRAHASVSSVAESSSQFVDSASGRTFQFHCDRQRGFRWSEDVPSTRGGILQTVLETLLQEQSQIDCLPPLRISMNTDAFYRHVGSEPRKLGLGSSAAALVALAGALFDALALPVDREDVTRFSISAHRNFQGGQGSGVDIAAAANGGVLSIRQPQSGDTLHIERLAWPESFFMLPVWSGESASTVDLLSRLDAFRDRKPDAFDVRMRALKHAAELASTAWLERSAGRILAAINGYAEALSALDREADVGIVTDAHERLRALTEMHGGRYKTSGAGGGDFGFAYTDSAAVAEDVRKAFVDDGIPVLEVPSNTTGLIIDHDG